MGTVNDIMRRNALRNSTIVGYVNDVVIFVGKTYSFVDNSVEIEVIKGSTGSEKVRIEITDPNLVQMGDKLFFWNNDR